MILKLQRDEVNQSLYYTANLVDQQDITVTDDESCEDECAESPQATIYQLIEASGHSNINISIWADRTHFTN